MLNGGGLGIILDEGNILGGYDCVELLVGLGNLFVGICFGELVLFGFGIFEILFVLFFLFLSFGGFCFELFFRFIVLFKRIGLLLGRGIYVVGL